MYTRFTIIYYLEYTRKVMNPVNAKKYSITSLVLSVVSIIISVVFVLIIMAKAVALMAQYDQTTLTDAQIQELSLQLAVPMIIYFLIISVVAVVILVFYILAIIESNKLKDNRTPFILLLIGLFFGPAGLFGLIMLIVESNKILNAPPAQEPSVDAFFTE